MDFFLQSDGYEVQIGQGVSRQLTEFISLRPEISGVYVLTDSHTRAHCLPVLLKNVPAISGSTVLEVSPGESSKSLDSVTYLCEKLLEAGADRNSLVVNLGGGMIGDLGGFVASVFLRGIRFVQMPTSLLAMVDAAVGGKTGVNLNSRKNTIGLFAKPAAVFADTEFLRTLPVRELRSGLAEIIKHSFIANVPPVSDLPVPGDLKQVDWLPYIVSAVSYKNEVVTADFKDQHQRKLLNFGHTIGHALEGFSIAHDSLPLVHGEAIALGMEVELMLSVSYCGLSLTEMKKMVWVIKSYFGDLQMPAFSDELIPFLFADKKNHGNSIRCVLIGHDGNPQLDVAVSIAAIRDAIGMLTSIETVN